MSARESHRFSLIFLCSALILGASGGVGTFAIQVKDFFNLVTGEILVSVNL